MPQPIGRNRIHARLLNPSRAHGESAHTRLTFVRRIFDLIDDPDGHLDSSRAAQAHYVTEKSRSVHY